MDGVAENTGQRALLSQGRAWGRVLISKSSLKAELGAGIWRSS